MKRTGVVLPFRKATEPPPPRGHGWVVAIVLAGAVALGVAALLGGCGHSRPGRCVACTPAPEIENATQACVESEYGRVCGYHGDGSPCVDFLLRRECSGEWEEQGSECDFRGRDHGS